MTNLSKRGNPFNDTLLEGYWTNGTGPWPAPKGYYWICGKFAYSILPKRWCGSCVLGNIKPNFFLLLIPKGEKLGIALYEEKDGDRRKTSNKVRTKNR